MISEWNCPESTCVQTKPSLCRDLYNTPDMSSHLAQKPEETTPEFFLSSWSPIFMLLISIQSKCSAFFHTLSPNACLHSPFQRLISLKQEPSFSLIRSRQHFYELADYLAAFFSEYTLLFLSPCAQSIEDLSVHLYSKRFKSHIWKPFQVCPGILW